MIEEDPREVIATISMSSAQKLGVLATLLLTITDGFDLLAMSFAAPGITADWHLTRATLGYLMATNLIGMGLGAVLIAPLGDRFGRRRLVLAALIAIALSMVCSAAARTPIELGILRLITGLGIGGMVGATLALATEYANARNRTLTASIMSVGLPIGGMVGAIAAAFILRHHDWRSIFLIGSGVTIVVAVVSIFLLPESVDFLLMRPEASRRVELNRILTSYGLNAVPTGYQPPQKAIARGSYAGLVTPVLRGTTAAMVLINFAMMTTVYFLLGWLPQIVADMGFSKAEAAGIGAFSNGGGVLGALLLGWASRRFSSVWLTMVGMLATAATVILVAWVPHDLNSLRAAAALQGFMALGTSAGIYGVLAAAFPAQARSTGIGVSFGFGRGGTVAATIIPGILFTAGWANLAVAMIMALGALVAAATLFTWEQGRPARAAHVPN